MSDIINIDQFETIENIEISVFPTYTEINVNRITGGGGGGGAVSSVNGQIGDVVLTKTNLGLGNVDNTSDANKPISSATQTALDLKVDKITGKGLSSEDYTTAEKTKLGTIATGAEVNVNADWNATSGDAQILNKPTIPPAVTQTSQLTNNGADGINPFITALDIPTAGQASTLVREVKNMTGATLTKGTVVYISGANGNKALVSKALATTDALSSRTFGLLQSDILNNGLGNCVIIGDLSGLNTSAFTEGAQLYLSGVTAGTYTETKVLAPTHLVYVGKVTSVHPTQGQIEVGIQNGYEIAEIHDIAINGLADKQLLSYESSTSLWKNKTIDKTFVGLDNVDNTSDANKPVSTAQATAINAKVSDAIVDGVTTIAPSQNAVFDLFQFTRRLIANVSSSVTGTTAETILASLTIPANTLDSKCFVWTTMDFFKTNTGTVTLRLYINTTNSLSGATLIGFTSLGSNRNSSFNRKLYLNGTTLDFLTSNTGSVQVSNEFVEALFGASTTLTVNPANDIFLIYTTLNDAVGTIATNKIATIQKLKLN